MKSSLRTPWLGFSRGYLSDWVTQQWVRITGRQIELTDYPWLLGPIGKTDRVGEDFFSILAAESGLSLNTNRDGAGLIENFNLLDGANFEAGKVQEEVRDFYEHTSGYDLDVWAEWSGFFRPFGGLLGFLFSRRLQQLNLPLSSLDTSRGMTSEIIELWNPATSEVKHTAWMRKLVGTGNVLYAGCYSVCKVPGYEGNCVKVVFPLPNGNATVIMRPEIDSNNSMSIQSSGQRFGDPGFYFVVHNADRSAAARFVRGMRETIHVFKAENSYIRANHILTLFGFTFLRLHYRMKKSAPSSIG